MNYGQLIKPKKVKRRSTMNETIVPAIVQWVAAQLRSSSSPDNAEPEVCRFLEAADSFAITTPDLLVNALTDGVVLVQLLNAIHDQSMQVVDVFQSQHMPA